MNSNNTPSTLQLFGPQPWESNPAPTAGSFTFSYYYFATPSTAAALCQIIEQGCGFPTGSCKVVEAYDINPTQSAPNQMIQLPEQAGDVGLRNAGLMAQYFEYYSQIQGSIGLLNQAMSIELHNPFTFVMPPPWPGRGYNRGKQSAENLSPRTKRPAPRKESGPFLFAIPVDCEPSILRRGSVGRDRRGERVVTGLDRGTQVRGSCKLFRSGTGSKSSGDRGIQPGRESFNEYQRGVFHVGVSLYLCGKSGNLIVESGHAFLQSLYPHENPRQAGAPAQIPERVQIGHPNQE